MIREREGHRGHPRGICGGFMLPGLLGFESHAFSHMNVCRPENKEAWANNTRCVSWMDVHGRARRLTDARCGQSSASLSIERKSAYYNVDLF